MSEQIAWTFTNSSRSRIGPTCPTCDRIHCSTDVVAVDRFDSTKPTRYMPAGGGVIRSTRGEAMADVCATRVAKVTADQTEENEHG